jgi:hypothetical protein
MHMTNTDTMIGLIVVGIRAYQLMNWRLEKKL